MPSVHETTKISCSLRSLLPGSAGNQSSAVTYASSGIIWPIGSWLIDQRQTLLSSEHETSSLVNDQPTAVHVSRCCRATFTSSRMAIYHQGQRGRWHAERERYCTMAEPHGVSVELEHAIGFRGGLPNSLFLLPGGEEAVHVSGACVVIASLADPHQQTFLRGHTEPISCLHVSPDGRLAASGQRGRVADVIVWDLARRCELYRLQEHDAKIDGGISNAAFSEDGRFLLTVGLVPEDKKMVVWDMSSGCIVASVERGVPTACVAFGGRVKDVKRRPTTHPQFVSAGDDGLKFWDLDPARGALSSVPCNTLAQVRSYSCVAFSANEDVFFAGTLTGDFCVLNAPRRLSSGELERVQLRLSVLVCSGGVHCMRVGGAGLYVGGGDGTVTLYDTADEGFKPRRLAAGLAGAVTSVALSAERGVALYGTTAAAIYEHALGGEGGPPRAVALSHGARVVGVAYAPGDSVRFATASHDLSVRVWSASDYSVEMEVSSRNCGLPLCVAFSGAAVFVGWEDGKIRAYDADEAAELWAIDNCHRGGVTALALSANGRFVCSGGARGEVRVWELKSRMLASHLVQHDDAVRAAARASCARPAPWPHHSRALPHAPAVSRCAGDEPRHLGRRPAALLVLARQDIRLLGPASGEAPRHPRAGRRRHQRPRAAARALAGREPRRARAPRRAAAAAAPSSPTPRA